MKGEHDLAQRSAIERLTRPNTRYETKRVCALHHVQIENLAAFQTARLTVSPVFCANSSSTGRLILRTVAWYDAPKPRRASRTPIAYPPAESRKMYPSC